MLAELGAQHGPRAGAGVFAQRLPVGLVGSEDVLVPAAVEHQSAVVERDPGDPGGQRGLPDAGLPADQGEYPVPGAGPLPAFPQGPQLGHPADEGGVRHAGQPAEVGAGGMLAVAVAVAVGVVIGVSAGGRLVAHPGRGGRVGGSQRREGVLQAGYGQLPDPLGLVEVLQPVLAEVAHVEAVGQGVLDERVGDLRQQDLPAVPGGAQPGRPVYPEPDEPAGPRGRLGGVEAHPDADPGAGRPLVRRQRALGGDRRRHGILGGTERDEERIALGVDLPAVVGGEGLPLQALAGGQDVAVAFPVPAYQPGRALDVGEQQRHRARGGRFARQRIGQHVLVDEGAGGDQAYPRSRFHGGLVRTARLVGSPGGVGDGHIAPLGSPGSPTRRRSHDHDGFGPLDTHG